MKIVPVEPSPEMILSAHKSRKEALARVDSKYGAPMGRADQGDMSLCECVFVEIVRMEDGDYDVGGAYWGGGGTPLYLLHGTDKITGEECYSFTRASNPSVALSNILSSYALGPKYPVRISLLAVEIYLVPVCSNCHSENIVVLQPTQWDHESKEFMVDTTHWTDGEPRCNDCEADNIHLYWIGFDGSVDKWLHPRLPQPLKFPHVHNKEEKQILNLIIQDALALGFDVTVHNGEEAVLKRSTDAQAIANEIGTTDEGHLRFRKKGTEGPSHTIFLVHGNGCDLISDCSDTGEMKAILANAEALISRLSGNSTS